jgi:hypothetical protein
VAVVALAGAADRVRAEFRPADGGVRSRPWPVMWPAAFELAVPWRGFPSFRRQSNFPGWWWSATTGGHVGYESWLERDHVMVLDFDRAVTGLSSQPFRLSCTATGLVETRFSLRATGPLIAPLCVAPPASIATARTP